MFFMKRNAACPMMDSLIEIAKGASSTVSSDELEQHLLQCSSCSSAMEELMVDHPLMKLASKIIWPPIPIDPETEKLNRRIIETLEARLATDTINSSSGHRDLGIDLDWLELPDYVDDLGKLGDFRILRLIGHGGMGAVFEAVDQRLQRRVAIKVILPGKSNDVSVCERFLREARTAASLHHRNVVTIFEVGQSGKVPYLAMELLQGKTLEDRLKEEPVLPIIEVLRIGREMVEGLAVAHAKGLIHRDIKPANVWLEENGDECVKLLDFGLARSFTESSELTDSGLILGTPAYMSPEQANGQPINDRTDLFSLGVVLYRMTTGSLPFPGRTTLEILNSLATITPMAPLKARENIPESLSALIQHLLAKDPSSRPDSAIMISRRLTEIERELDRTVETCNIKTASSGGRNRVRVPKSIALFFGGMSLVALMSIIVFKIKTKDGKETEVVVSVPGDVESVKATIGDSKELELSARLKSDASDTTQINPSIPPRRKSETIITPAAFARDSIPDSELFAWQPDELVAVIGDHRLRHWNRIDQIRFHPSGKFFLSVDSGGTGKVWQVETLECSIDSIPGDVRLPSRFSFSPDGQSIGFANQLFLVDTANPNQPKFNFSKKFENMANQFGTAGIAIHENRWMIVPPESRDGFLIWDTFSNSTDMKQPVRCEGLEPYHQISLSKNGRRLLAFGTGFAQIVDVDWENPTAPTFSLCGEKIQATTAAISPDGNTLVTASDGQSQFTVWDITHLPFEQAKSFSQPVYAFEFSSDSQTLYVGAFGHVDSYRYAKGSWGQYQRTLADDSFGAVSALTVSPDNKTLIAGCIDGGIHVWDVSHEEPKSRSPKMPASNVQNLTFAPDGLSMMVQGIDNQAAIWKLNSPPHRLEWNTFCDPAQIPSFSPDSKLVRVQDQVWNLGSEIPSNVSEPVNILTRFGSHGNILNELDSRGLCSRKWEITQRGRFTVGEPHLLWRSQQPDLTMDAIETLQFESMRFATRPDEQTVCVWNMVDLKKPFCELNHNLHFGNSTRPLTLSADGSVLLAFSQQASVVWDLEETPPRKYPLNLNGLTTSVLFIKNTKLLIVSDANGVGVYDWVNNRELRRLKYPGPVRQIVQHPDGIHLASVNGNGTVYILRMPELLIQNPK